MVKHLTYTVTIEEKKLDWASDRHALEVVGQTVRKVLKSGGLKVYKLTAREVRDRPTDRPELIA